MQIVIAAAITIILFLLSANYYYQHQLANKRFELKLTQAKLHHKLQITHKNGHDYIRIVPNTVSRLIDISDHDKGLFAQVKYE